jgi:ribose/xylose/arabinose/galactoside ABC-type transport system permease subunit
VSGEARPERRWGETLRGKGRSQSAIIAAVIVVLSAAIAAVNPVFISPANLFAILLQSSVTAIATMCMLLLMVSGGLDFSIGSIISLACVVMARLVAAGYGQAATALIGVGLAALCGLANGFIVSKSRCPPIIITLGMLYVYHGLALNVAEGKFLSLGGSFDAMGSARLWLIPVPVLVALAVALLMWVLLTYVKYGRRLVAIGGNEDAAFLAGINIDFHKISAYALNGLIAGIAALVLVSRLGSVISTVGDDYALRALSAAVIGGVSFQGGRGTVGGALLGVILLGVVYNAMNILGISSYYQSIVLGVIVVAAVVFSNLGALRSRR